MKKQTVLTLIFIFITLVSGAQYFQTGEDPASLHWRQIQTPDFQLIFPQEFENKAKIMASYFEKVYQYGSVTLHHKPRKISIIFHTRTVQSNGLVGWAPRRMELFTPPHQAIYAQDWLEQLAIHEFRHVVQVDKIHSEIPQIIKLLLGEQGDALITGLYLPFWFIEGDAVVTETALSNTGRGRLASFLMEYKAQLVEKGRYSFDKAINGSFKDYVPNHYNLGYLLVGESRARYGSDLWSRVIDRLAGKPLSVNPVNHVLRKITGMNQQELYESVFDSLRLCWQKEDQKYPAEHYKVLTKPSDGFLSYQYNHILTSGDIISLRSDYDKIPGFVRIDSLGREEVILTPGRIFDESVGYRNNLIIWSEFIPDVRWSHSGRSFIRLYDIEKKQTSTIIPEYKCFAPSISPDEHNVAVIETDFGNNYYLSVYNAHTGDLISRFQTKDNNYFFNPVWKTNDEILVVVLTEHGKQIADVRPFTKELTWFPTMEMGEIKQLVVDETKLYFIGSRAGKDELYSMDLNSHEMRREVTSRFGLGYPAWSDNHNCLILSDYTSFGYRLVSIDSSDITSNYICNVTNVTYSLADSLSAQEPGVVDFSKVKVFPYVSEPYHKGLHLINFHSWGPFSLDAGTYTFRPGVSVSSQNKLGTLQTTLGYRCNIQEREGQYYINLEYKGSWPVISMEVSTGRRNDSLNQITIYKDQSGKEIRRESKMVPFSWGQSDLGISLKLPLNFSRDSYSSILQPSLTYQLAGYTHNQTTPTKFIEGVSHSVVWRTGFYRISREAYKDLQPRWGIVTDVSYRHSPFGGQDKTKLASAELKGYLPGVFRHNGVSLYAGVQKRERGIYRSYNDVNLPVGWNIGNMPAWWGKVENDAILTGSVRYCFPLSYPDLNISKLLYFKRIKAALFYNFGQISGDDIQNGKITGSYKKELTSFGMDFSSDVHLLRFYAPIETGIKMAYLPAVRKPFFEMILSVNFNSF
jgi:hypothetical protein